MGYFDRVWRTHGMGILKREFAAVVSRDRARAARQLNGEDATFPVLFILMPELDRFGFYKELSPRNISALRITTKKTTGDEKLERYLRYLEETETEQSQRDTLRWIIETGIDWDGPSAGRDEYDTVIDYAVALLVGDHGDNSQLAKIAELIFRRNRSGLFIHDLVWGFFRSVDADALSVVAKYIVSTNRDDVELACQMLGLDVPETMEAQEKTFTRYTDYLSENKSYLYLTGEGFQASSAPRHLTHDPEAKYLRREISPRDRAPLAPLSEIELKALTRFREAKDDVRELLIRHSGKVKTRGDDAWHNWINSDIARQVLAAQEDEGENI
ncbi:MAG: hypothetical protein LBN30_00250 [Oscillospiraceae bacterium]|jgi:hypothetical protein|nr:hypothetical protein [Oscillospiraceae bacterium]